MNIFGFLRRKEKTVGCRVEMFLADGTPVNAKTIAWIEQSVAQGKMREEAMQKCVDFLGCELDAREQALRIAYDFLLSNSDRESHAGRIAGVIRRVLGGKVMLVGLERSLRARIEAGMVITKDELNP